MGITLSGSRLMESPLTLQPCRLSPELLQGPLPFDLYSSNGTLLSRQGSRLKSAGDNLTLFRVRPDAGHTAETALRLLTDLFHRYGQLTERWACTVQDVRDMQLLADELAELCDTHSDVCVCMAAYLPGKSHATRHSFAVAIVAILLATTLGWHAGRLPTLARAAMTMNLSLLSNHDDWARTRGALNESQRMNVRRHPGLSADLLAQTPGVDLRWINAVDQHHENLDGSGYPLGLMGDEISPEARVLRVADSWCALVLHGSGRGKKTPRAALEELTQAAGAHLDLRVFVALKNLMGPYPPGALVRLENRETAVVIRWVRNASMPLSALSIFSPSGETLLEFKRRDMRQFGFGIRDYTLLNLAQMSRLPWQRVWTSA